MMKVWMVHAEHGEYSDWTYAVAGVFSTYEKAREYVLACLQEGLTNAI